MDAGELHTGCVFFRWIGLPPQTSETPPPTLRTRIVKLAEVERKGADRVTPARRADMLKRRRDAYSRWR